MFVRYFVYALLMGVAFLFLAFLLLGIWIGLRTPSLERFSASVDVPIGPDGYGVVHIDPGNVVCEEVRVVSADGLAFLDAEFGSSEACEPRNWSLYVAHPSNGSVHVELDVDGYLPRDASSPEIASVTPSSLPWAEVVSVAFDAPSTDSLLAVDSSVPWRSYAAVSWTGTPEMDFSYLEDSSCRWQPESTAFVLVEEPISGVLSALNIQSKTPRRELTVRKPVGVLKDSIQGESGPGAHLYAEVTTMDGIDPNQMALVMSGTGSTRGQDPRAFQLPTMSKCGGTDGYYPTQGRFGQSVAAVANCDGEICTGVRLGGGPVHFDWVIDLTWVFFDSSETPELPRIAVEITDHSGNRLN